MNIKAIIGNFEKLQEDIESDVFSLKLLFENEKSLWESYEEKNLEFFLNERIINFFADSLRLVNNQGRLEKYELEDIQRIYEILVRYYPDNIQYQEDLISFVYNVMDDEDQTSYLIGEAMKRMDSKRKYFKKILNQIKKDK